MPLIPEETIEQVRQSTDIVEVVSDHVVLTKRGRNYVGLCPFHDDRRPSFNVSQEKQIYKCFACDAGGNVFTFLMEMERISFVEAVRKLAERAGVPLPESRDAHPVQEEAIETLYRANDLALKYYRYLLLNDPAGKTALEYLRGRDVSDDAIETFSLGYAPNAWDGLLQVAGRRGFSPQVLERAGLALPRRDGTGYYDRFRHRVMFPIQATTGRTVAFGARALDPEEQAKYLNSPETPAYHKSAILYGLYPDRDAIRTERTAVVVEGYMDLIALAQRGIPHAVASAGTALTPDHGRLLRRFADRAVLVFDGDAAGTAAAARGIGSLLESGIETRVVSLPEGHDPDSFIREQGPEGFRALLEGADSALDFLIAWVSAREDLSTADGKARAAAALAETISRVGDETLRKLLITETAEKLHVDDTTIIGSIQKVRQPRPAARGRDATVPDSRPVEFDPRPRSERELLVWMMADDAIADAILKQVRAEDFTNSVYRRIAGIIAQRREQNQSAAVALLLDACEDLSLKQIISAFSMEVGMADPDRPEAPLQDYIDTFRLKNLNDQIDALEAKLSSTGTGPDHKSLLQQHLDLTEQRKALAKSRRK